MKKLKLVFKGSLSEQKFLEQKRQEGYYLTSVINGIYTFKYDQAVTHTKLQINFVKTEGLKATEPFQKNNPFFAVTTKPLNFSKHTVIYSYLKDVKNPVYNYADTKTNAYQYLKHLQNIILAIAILVLFICIALWSYFTAHGNTNPMTPLPMKIMSVVFVGVLLLNLALKRRIRKSFPTYVDQFYLSYSVSIQSKKAPDLDKLKHLGAWRYVTQKNDKYYYNLHSKQPKDSIIHSICTRLDMKPEQIFVYSALDLFPIRAHF